MFGSGIKAERWLSNPKLGLGRRIPQDLLKAPSDYEVLASFLVRLEYGVYHCLIAEATLELGSVLDSRSDYL
ncbi:hypothetical protein [Pseudomonas protegens]|uniref:hypothetical protein n=1 Tax=Pseudomonas protegens TaxID=380021 RepID=UPI00384CF20F